MDAPALERYLQEHIPLSAAMATTVVKATPEEVLLGAALEPNLNHRNTAFGGSVGALAILAGWTLVHLRLRADGVDARTVVQRSDVSYLHPVADDFQARALPPDPEAWRRFRRALKRFGRGRVAVRVEVLCGGELVAELDGDYVSLLANA